MRHMPSAGLPSFSPAALLGMLGTEAHATHTHRLASLTGVKAHAQGLDRGYVNGGNSCGIRVVEEHTV